MLLPEIIEKLPTLSRKERQLIYRRIVELDGEPEFIASDEMLAAIDEGIHSLKTEPTVSFDDACKAVEAWSTKSP